MKVKEKGELTELEKAFPEFFQDPEMKLLVKQIELPIDYVARLKKQFKRFYGGTIQANFYLPFYMFCIMVRYGMLKDTNRSDGYRKCVSEAVNMRVSVFKQLETAMKGGA